MFGQSDSDVQTLFRDAQRHVAKLQLVQISMPPKLVAAVLAYTKETPNLYADLNRACRTSGGRWETLLGHYRDYLYHLNRSIQALPNFSGKVYRGIDEVELGNAYTKGQKITWQQFSSASKKLRVALRFLHRDFSNRLSGSLFVLQVSSSDHLDVCG